MRSYDPDALTARESEVLDLIRRGLTNEEIAQRLGISLDGAKYHVSQILSKLGVATREEAAVWRPEQRRWYWKLAWIGVAGAVATTVAGIALAVSDRGTSVTVEPGVFADEPVTSLPSSSQAGQTASHTPTHTPTPFTPTDTYTDRYAFRRNAGGGVRRNGRCIRAADTGTTTHADSNRDAGFPCDSNAHADTVLCSLFRNRGKSGYNRLSS
jgi:DNA-binding CsgD family transcriptional regulator